MIKGGPSHKTAHASEQERPEVAVRRQAWFDAQPDLDPEHLVFIDEDSSCEWPSQARSAMSITGSACSLEDDDVHRRIRLSGMTAPVVRDGPMTGEWSVAYVEQILLPMLRLGDVLILDNLPAQKGAAARDAIEATGAQMLFLPPFRPTSTDRERLF